YEKLSQEKAYTEYCIILKLKGQQAQRQQDTILLTSDSARKLASAGDVSAAYRATLKELAEKQYEMLGQTLEVTGQISELNLVFLMRMSGKLGGSAAKPAADGTKGSEAPSSSPSFGTKPGTRAPQSTSQLLDAYLRRAAEFEAKSDFGKAILELREAIQIDPKSSTAHSRLGVIYMKNNQSTMAKIHFNKALELNPQDPVALEGKRRLDITTGNQAKKPDAKPGKASSSKDGKPGQSGGGLFGLFGGKKK
ncbi:MAG TPA: tetratricopeptide repeat protein, partial [Chroococcidiopsis sp.]